MSTTDLESLLAKARAEAAAATSTTTTTSEAKPDAPSIDDVLADSPAPSTLPAPSAFPVELEALERAQDDQALNGPVSDETKTDTSKVDSILTDAGPTTPAMPAPEPKTEKPVAKAEPITIDSNLVLSGTGTLAVHETLSKLLKRTGGPTFKVAALQSGYTAEFGALNFEETARLQASAVDAHASRVKLLRVVHGRVHEFSCGAIKFEDWLKLTAQGDYDTLLYGLYAATYPGENEFEVRCRHCGHENKVIVPVGSMARIEGAGVMDEIKRLLDPSSGYKGAITNSLVGRRVQRKLPETGIVVEITNPSLQDYLDGVQWFVQAQDRATGELPANLAGAETIRTLVMYVPRALIPMPGTNQYVELKGSAQLAQLIGKLSRADGQALVDAVDAEVKDLNVSYQLPAFNCGSCGKRNEDLVVDFETLLFFKLREKA